MKALDLAVKEGAPYGKADPGDVYGGKYPLSRFLYIYVNMAPTNPRILWSVSSCGSCFPRRVSSWS